MFRYKLLRKKGEGTFSEVLKAQNIETGSLHAIKCMKQTFSNLEQVNSLREIQALRRLSSHPNIITLQEVLFDKPTGKLALVFELLSANLYDVIRERERPFSAATVQAYAHQIMTCIAFIHNRGVFHRDIKPENILVDVTRKNIKLADFGSVRGIHSHRPYTEYISTRWYRAPECLLTDGEYGAEVDVWGAGCVIFELIALSPLFPGSDEIDQINKIHQILGSPPPLVWMKLKISGSRNLRIDFPVYRGTGFGNLIPRARQDSISFLYGTLKYDPTERITAAQALEHTYLVSFNVKSSEENKHRERVANCSQNINKNVGAKLITLAKITPNSDVGKMHTEAKPREKLKGTFPSSGKQRNTLVKTNISRKANYSTTQINVNPMKGARLPTCNGNVISTSTTQGRPAKPNHYSKLVRLHSGATNCSSRQGALVAIQNEQGSKESLPLLGQLRSGNAQPLVRRKNPYYGSLNLQATNKTALQRGAQSSVAAAASPTTSRRLLPPIRNTFVNQEEERETKLLPVHSCKRNP